MGKEKRTINQAEKAHLHGVLSASYQRNKDAEKTLSQQGYTLDRDLSGRRAKVFHDQNGKAHVVYRGTQNVGDAVTDLAFGMGLGKYTSRAKHSKKVYKQAQEKYGHKDVSTYGHSLGGYLAETSASKNANVTTFNKAAKGDKVRNPNQVDVRTKHDVVSAMTPTHKGSVQIKGSKDPLKAHALDALLV